MNEEENVIHFSRHNLFQPMLSIEDVSHEVQKTAILTFASLVNKMCLNGRCKPETADKYIRVYVDKFTGKYCLL